MRVKTPGGHLVQGVEMNRWREKALCFVIDFSLDPVHVCIGREFNICTYDNLLNSQRIKLHKIFAEVSVGMNPRFYLVNNLPDF